MNYSINFEKIQSNNEINYIKLPSLLQNFCNTDTVIDNRKDGKVMFKINGYLELTVDDYICPNCGEHMHINNNFDVELKHLNFGFNYSKVCFNKVQFYCTKCNHSKMQNVPFQAEGHRITIELENYATDLLAAGYTNKEVSEITGLGKNVVKDIDLKRLKKLYVEDGKLIKPKQQAKYLGIDEFKLHDGYKYATHIIDLETGHILWIAKGKKKQIVYDFIEHVGEDWMKNVVAVACDMNSDFEEAFIEKCPHISIVFDYFHLVKNFNEKVVNVTRKSEYKRLIDEKRYEDAEIFKKSKYIVTSSIETLRKKDLEVLENKTISKGSDLFKTPEIIRKGNYEEKYNKIIKENELFLIAHIIKEKLKLAYSRTDSNLMAIDLVDIAILCYQTNNKHFIWFANLIKNHFNGIISHAKYKISSGKIEGINNKIKTLRRQAYGYPDDEYFFLKLLDMSRN